MVRSDEQKGNEVPPDDLPGLDDHLGSPTPDEPVTPEASGHDWEAIDRFLDEWKAHLDTEGARREAEKEDFAWRRLILIAGDSGLTSLVLVMGLLFASGDTDDTAVAVPSETAVEDTAPPSTAASAEDTEPSAGAVDVPDVSAVPFPSSWTYTTTKTASIVPAHEFITATPIGAELPWAFNVTEACDRDACSYVTVIDLMFPGGVVGEFPEATWVVDGPEWSLDVTWHSGQSTYSDGTTCVIRNHEVFTLIVIEEIIGGRSVPTSFEGTWLQAAELDLGASTGDLTLCGDAWEYADEWSVAGVASS